MSTIIKEVYDAFLEAGVSDEKASAAAKAVADYDARSNKIEAGLLLIKWMIGLVIAVEVFPFLKTIFA